MSRTRRITALALSSLAGSAGLALAQPAHADTPVTLYVQPNANCATETGSQVAPMCSLDDAMNSPALVPGSAVIIQGTLTGGPHVWTRSGAPGLPITISSFGPQTAWGISSSAPGPALTLSGVHDVVLSSTTITGPTGVAVTGSQNVTIQDSNISGVDEGVWIQDSTGISVDANQVRSSVYIPGVTETTGDGIVVTGTSSGTRLTRNSVIDTAGSGDGILLEGGSQGTVVARNEVQGGSPTWQGSDIRVKNSTNDTVTSNTFKYGFQSLTASDGSTGLTVADNIFYDERPVTPAKAVPPMVSVDASSVTGTTLDRDVVYRSFDDLGPGIVPATGALGDTLVGVQTGTGPAYSWAGTTRADAAALEAATDQAVGEITANPVLEPYSFQLSSNSPAIDSADSGAPGWQSTDFNGATSPFQDPNVTTTGTGSPAYADRGASEFQGGPQVAVSVTPLTRVDPASGQTQYGYHLDMSASASPFAAVKSYYFLPGQGETTGTPAGPVVDYWYCLTCGGPQSIDLSVTDTASHMDSKRLWLQVPQSTPPSGGGGGGGGGTTGPIVHQIGGQNRYETSQEVSQAQWQAGTAGAVVLARGDQAPDALAGVPLAAHVHGPLLLTDPTTLDPATRAEIDRATGGPQTHKTVYILGGEGAVSPSIETSLRSAGYTVVRYQGATRYGTALAIAGAFGPTAHVLVATGQNFPDALAAGPLGAAENAPIVLSDGNTLDPDTATFILAHPAIDPVGGFAQRAVATLNTTGKTVNPNLGGNTRYDTAAAVATAVVSATGHAPTAVGIASGINFPDALTGGAYAANAGIPLLITDPLALSDQTMGRLSAWANTPWGNPLKTVTVFGGPGAVNPPVVNQIAAVVHGKVQ